MYDVTVGRRHYGKQGKIRHLSSFISLHPLLFLVPLVLVSSLFSGSYNFFAGRDATRSLVTGCFDPKDPKCTVDSHLLVDPTEKQLEEISMPSPSPPLPLFPSPLLLLSPLFPSPSPPLPLSPSPPLPLSLPSFSLLTASTETWEDFYKNHKEYFYVGTIKDD